MKDGEKIIGKKYERDQRIVKEEKIIKVKKRDFILMKIEDYEEEGEEKMEKNLIMEKIGREKEKEVEIEEINEDEEYGKDEKIMVMKEDKMIEDEKELEEEVEKEREIEEEGRIVKLGIVKDRKEKGLGYIEVKGKDVKRFVEKKDEEKEKKYVERGRYLWN